jgi:glycerol-3-phosphate acyltransferase PlsX
MGGDNAPRAIIEGASMFASSNSEVYFFLYGDSAIMNPVLDHCSSLEGRYTVFHTDQFISSSEKPSVALKKGIKSSMRLAIDSAKEKNSDAVVSAGNTGALMAISKVILRSIPLISRPAIATYLPTVNKRATVMLDMGANIDCDAEILYQFAVMGHAFAKTILKVENPTIGILNVGTEDMKGSDMVRNAAALLKASVLSESFYGYVEGDDIAKGVVDVVVTDGFSGNVVLKSIEGTAKMVSGLLKEGFNNSTFAKIGYLLAKPALSKVLGRVDPRKYNGAMLVGLNGIVVKSHGSADKISFCNAINVAFSLVKDKVNDEIIEELKACGFSAENKKENGEALEVNGQ